MVLESQRSQKDSKRLHLFKEGCFCLREMVRSWAFAQAFLLQSLAKAKSGSTMAHLGSDTNVIPAPGLLNLPAKDSSYDVATVLFIKENSLSKSVHRTKILPSGGWEIAFLPGIPSLLYLHVTDMHSVI